MNPSRPSLDRDRLEHEVHNLRYLGARVFLRAETGSTNEDAHSLAAEAAPSGTIVVAEVQTSGRGQWGRTWTAPARSAILLSLLWRDPDPPRVQVPPVRWMAAAGVAVADTLQHMFGLAATLKWPNDVLIAGRKVAGILIERRAVTVVGIGLNVSIREEEFPSDPRLPPTSIEIELGHCVDRTECLLSLLARLDALVPLVIDASRPELEERWRTGLGLHPGEPIEVTTHQGSVRGLLRELALEGECRLDRLEGNDRPEGKESRIWAAPTASILRITQIPKCLEIP